MRCSYTGEYCPPPLADLQFAGLPFLCCDADNMLHIDRKTPTRYNGSKQNVLFRTKRGFHMLPMNLLDIQPSLRSLYGMCVEPVCQDYGITRTELDILLFLANNPKYDTAAEISDVRFLAKSHVSTSLKSLEQNGYIVKFSEDSDKRRVHLRLTEKADAVIQEGQARQSDFASIVTDGFNKEERQQLHSLLTRMSENIENYLEEHAK